jgi:hypothetical protein
MLTADVGFVATDRLAPNRRAVAAGNTSGAVTHRDVAAISMSAATVGYLIMVFRRAPATASAGDMAPPAPLLAACSPNAAVRSDHAVRQASLLILANPSVERVQERP